MACKMDSWQETAGEPSLAFYGELEGGGGGLGKERQPREGGHKCIIAADARCYMAKTKKKKKKELKILKSKELFFKSMIFLTA